MIQQGLSMAFHPCTGRHRRAAVISLSLFTRRWPEPLMAHGSPFLGSCFCLQQLLAAEEGGTELLTARDDQGTHWVYHPGMFSYDCSLSDANQSEMFLLVRGRIIWPFWISKVFSRPYTTLFRRAQRESWTCLSPPSHWRH